MPLREMLQRILTEYPTAKDLPYKGHALARIIRVDAKRVLEAALGEMGVGLFFKGSPGQSDWVTVPWIAIFDPAITRRTTRGYYVVYLFHASEPIVHQPRHHGSARRIRQSRSRGPARPSKPDAQASNRACILFASEKY